MMGAVMKRVIAFLIGLCLLPVSAGAQVIEYYHLDAVGNVRAVTDQQGRVIERHDYLPFGEEWNPQGGTQPLRFTGKERDAETGLDYFGARYYGSSIGRFTTVDPVYTWRENLVDPQRWNRYAYVRNNPLRYVDPDGRELKLAIYHGTLPAKTAQGTAEQIAANLTRAGVKNVTFELKAGSPGMLEVLRYGLLPTPHSHLLDLRDDRKGSPSIRSQEAGHNWDLGGHSAVATSVVKARTTAEEQLITGISNLATHEVAHDALGHTDTHDFMKAGGAASDNWLFDTKLAFTPSQAQRLQREYNRPGEVQRR